MNPKLVLISLYIVLVYWVSLQLPALHALFYPTLGAFSFLLASRNFDLKEAGRILLGATVSSAVGSALHTVHPGAVSLLADTLLVGWLIQRFRWNAPPILAVSIIPFFVPQTNLWAAPTSVFISLLGLLVVLESARLVSVWWNQLSLRDSGIAQEID